MIARMQKAMKEKDGGFTLVELIVVVVIIGVLAAIAVPVFMKQTENAKTKSDLATLSNAKIAVASYLAETTPSGNSIAASDLANYGFPQANASAPTQTMTVAYTAATSSAAATWSISMTSSASGKTCSVASPTAAPACA